MGILRTIARTVAPLAFSRQSKRIRKASNAPYCGLAWNGAVYVEWRGSLPLRGKPLHTGSKRTSRNYQMSKRRLCLRHQTMCSNWMKSGVLCRRKSKNGGCGQRCAAEHGRLWPSLSVTAAKRPVFVAGTRFRRAPNTDTPSVIFGKPTNTFSQLKPIVVLRRKLGRLRIWNGGTTPYANGLGAMCDRRYLFPNPMSIMISSPNGVLFSIIRAYHLPPNHYRIMKTRTSSRRRMVRVAGINGIILRHTQVKVDNRIFSWVQTRKQ